MAREPVVRELGLRIHADGSWSYQGSPINRPALVKLFASVLRREGDVYWLVTPVERGEIEVDDVPFVGVELRRQGSGATQTLDLRTNLDVWVTIGRGHPLTVRSWQPERDAAPSLVPYVEVSPGLDARLLRPVYYELIELGEDQAVDGKARFGVWSDGVFFPLDAAGALEDAAARDSSRHG